jgi:hypothetical protein
MNNDKTKERGWHVHTSCLRLFYHRPRASTSIRCALPVPITVLYRQLFFGVFSDQLTI